MSNFTLFKKTISFPQSSDRYYMSTLERNNAMSLAEADFLDFYRSKGDIRSVLEKYMETAGVITKRRALDILYKKLPSIGIYDVTEKAFTKECWDLENAGEAFDKIVDQYNEIEEGLALERAYREERKESRGEWVGGGFGLGGAINGALTAGALNLASGLSHDIVNSIGNAGSEKTAANAKKRLYISDETYKTLCIGIKYSIWDIYIAYIMLVNQYFEDADDLYFTNSFFNEDKAQALFKNAKQLPDKREELLVEALRLCPYYAEALEYLFQHYPEERKNVCEIAHFYRIDISDLWENIFAERYAKTEKTDERELLAARAEIVEDMETYGVKSSKTLEALDDRYMKLVHERYYRNALPGERGQALELLRELDSVNQLKVDFVNNNHIWELREEYHVTFSKETDRTLLRSEYLTLLASQASEEKIAAVLDDMLTALGYKGKNGFYSADKKKELFLMLCGKEECERSATDAAVTKKEALLSETIKYIEKTVTTYNISTRPYLEYRKGEANKHAKELKVAHPAPGEYVLMTYSPSLDKSQRYNDGFVVTDKRMVYRERGCANIPVNRAPSFRSGGFLSDDIIATVGNNEYSIRVTSLNDKKHLAECLQNVFKSLAPLQDELKATDHEMKESIQINMARCIQNNTFLVQYFDMQELAAQIIAESDNTIKAQKRRRIRQIMDTVKKTEPDSIADVWVQLYDSGIEPELFARAQDELYRCLCELAKTANSVERLKQIELAWQTILPHGDKEIMQTLKAAIDGRHDEAARLGEQARQQQVTAHIMSGCELANLASILECWSAFLQSDCEVCHYESYLKKLDAAILDLLDNAATLPDAIAMRDQLSKNDKERYQKYIRYAEERICALDIAQRTYRGVLFDSVEDIAYAKEEEKKLDIIMRTVSQDDAASMDNAILQISESPSEIKQVYLDTLDRYKQTLIEQQKTYRGVVYETPELAEQAKTIHVAMRSIMNDLDLSIEQNVMSAYERINAMDHPITKDTLKQLEAHLKKFDIEKRTVDGILFDTLQQADLARTEHARICDLMTTLNEGDEVGMLAIKAEISSCTTEVKEKYLKIVDNKLIEYDIKIRTFCGTTYATREIAKKHREEASIISDIMNAVNVDDEPSMLAALDALKHLTTFQKDAPIASVTKWLDEYDLKVRTVAGVLYDTREEALLVATELRRAEEIMQTVCPDDEESILSAQRAILELTTFVKDARYEELNQIWMVYDAKMRTYQDIVFETRKQAQTAQAEHTEFLRQFNTLDLSQRKTLLTLNDFVEDRIPEELKQRTLAMIDGVRNVLDIVDYIIQKDAEIDMATQKKESAELHKRIESVLPEMTRYRMSTDRMQQLKDKHYASLNVAKKLFSFIKSKL